MAAEKTAVAEPHENEIKTKITKFFVPCHERILCGFFCSVYFHLSFPFHRLRRWFIVMEKSSSILTVMQSNPRQCSLYVDSVWLFFACSWIDSIIFTIFHRNKSYTNGIKLVFPIQVLSFPFDFRMPCNVHLYCSWRFCVNVFNMYMLCAKYFHCANLLLPNYI